LSKYLFLSCLQVVSVKLQQPHQAAGFSFWKQPSPGFPRWAPWHQGGSPRWADANTAQGKLFQSLCLSGETLKPYC